MKRNMVQPDERMKPPPQILRHRQSWLNRPLSRPASARPAGPGEESVWDYPRPPRLEPVTIEVVVYFAGVDLARTHRALRVCETASPPTFYLPPEDIRTEHLVSAAGQSICEWKGQARYWSVRVGEQVAEQAAWSYSDPFEEFAAIKDYLAFYPGRVDRCTVDGQLVCPQPGHFYGGWITPNLVGPFKGEPGTEGW